MTDDNTKKPIERKAYQDLDIIAGLANAGITAIQTDNYDGAEDVLKQIQGIAEAWETSQ